MASKNNTYHKITTYEARKGEAKKTVVLYSGSVYTSVLIKWLSKEYKTDIIALTVDIGQRTDFEGMKRLAYELGAASVVTIDAKEQFVKDYITPAIKANATYEGKYHLLTPLSRPLFASLAVKLAEKEGASAIAHASTGQSNDQVRLDGTILTLNPDMKIIAPIRDGSITRQDALRLAKEYKIPQENIDNAYNYDRNLWGATIEGGNIENPQIPSRIEHLLQISTIPENAPEIPERITITYLEGVPTVLNDKKMSLLEIIETLNTIGGRHGIGLVYSIEDTIFGIKYRIIEEQPAAELLISSHRELEKYVSTREENEFKPLIDNKWGYLCHDGKWLEPLMKNLNGYINQVNKKVTGKVTLRLYKGTAEIINIQTPKTIFERKLATFMNAGVINQRAVAGYIEIATLPMRLANRAERTILLTIGQRTNKFKLLPQLRKLDKTKYRLYATYKTHKFLKNQDISSILVSKISEPNLKPNLTDLLNEKRFDLIIRIPSTKKAEPKEKLDAQFILQKAQEYAIPLITTLEEAEKVLEELQTTA